MTSASEIDGAGPQAGDIVPEPGAQQTPTAPQLPEVDSPPPDEVLDGVPSTEDVVEDAQTAEDIIRDQPSVDDVLGRG